MVLGGTYPPQPHRKQPGDPPLCILQLELSDNNDNNDDGTDDDDDDNDSNEVVP
jgi:hypothetical protein